MIVFVNRLNAITDHPTSVTLIAENETDSRKLREITELIPDIVIGESRSVRTGVTRIVEIGMPRRTVEDDDNLRSELLTALIECDDYATLYARCMELVERDDIPAEQSVESQSG